MLGALLCLVVQVARSNADDYEAVVAALRCRILELERGDVVVAALGPAADRSQVCEAAPSLAGGSDRVFALLEARSPHDLCTAFLPAGDDAEVTSGYRSDLLGSLGSEGQVWSRV